jgi:hypothetical protein
VCIVFNTGSSGWSIGVIIIADHDDGDACCSGTGVRTLHVSNDGEYGLSQGCSRHGTSSRRWRFGTAALNQRQVVITGISVVNTAVASGRWRSVDGGES